MSCSMECGNYCDISSLQEGAHEAAKLVTAYERGYNPDNDSKVRERIVLNSLFEPGSVVVNAVMSCLEKRYKGYCDGSGDPND